jgi:ABC-type transport system involved in Fe-S cluster assembly fused permease/ATPase subunit
MLTITFHLLVVAASVVMTRWRTRIRRQMNERDVVCIKRISERDGGLITCQITRGIHTDCLLNYETVKYFNGEEYEGARYRDAIREYQFFEYKVISKSQSCPPLILLRFF